MSLIHLCGTLVFFGLSLGLAWPLSSRLMLDGMEKIVVCAALSILGVFLLAWIVYIGGLPAFALWLVPTFATIVCIAERDSLAAVWRAPGARELLLSQLLVTGWCVGWLAFVTSYSGGGWVGDWFEHWERARFFLERWPLDWNFLGIYSLTARPPLANVVTGAYLVLTRQDFAHYQLITTLLGCLILLPAALLARRFSGGRTVSAMLALLLMLNPLFVQNATFAWTKLPAAFFVLTGLYFFLRAHDPAAPPAAAALCGATLGAGMLTHYSAGPYALLLAAAWLVLGRRRSALTAALAGVLVLAIWFSWAFAAYGAGGTLLANSSVTATDSTLLGQLAKIVLNLRDTLVPHFLRPLDASLITQLSPWSWWRDWFFQLYQLNLFFAFGSAAWLVILYSLAQAGRVASARSRGFWAAFVTGTIVLGVAVHGARDTWGLAHICLQPLVILGLAFLAARVPLLGRSWRLALMAGATVDFCIGIVLHFIVQSYAFDRWTASQSPNTDWSANYTGSAAMNHTGKLYNQLVFFGDRVASSLVPPLILLAVVLVISLRRAVVCAKRS